MLAKPVSNNCTSPRSRSPLLLLLFVFFFLLKKPHFRSYMDGFQLMELSGFHDFFFFQVDRENRDRQFVPAVFLYTAALKAFCVGCYRKVCSYACAGI